MIGAAHGLCVACLSLNVSMLKKQAAAMEGQVFCIFRIKTGKYIFAAAGMLQLYISRSICSRFSHHHSKIPKMNAAAEIGEIRQEPQPPRPHPTHVPEIPFTRDETVARTTIMIISSHALPLGTLGQDQIEPLDDHIVPEDDF